MRLNFGVGMQHWASGGPIFRDPGIEARGELSGVLIEVVARRHLATRETKDQVAG